MANETLQSTWSATNGVQIPHVLSKVPIPANLPHAVKQLLVNTDSIVGEQTETKRYAKLDDLGAGAAATEGVAISGNKELTPDTPVDVAVGENSTMRSQISDRAIERALGITDIQQFIYALQTQALSEDQIEAVFTPYAEAHVKGHIEKCEADLVGLNSGLSNVVGNSTDPCDLGMLLDAQITYNKLECPSVGPKVFELAPGQVGAIKKQLSITGGGMGGAVWGAGSNGAIINSNGDKLTNGYVDSLFGAAVYEVAQSVRDTGNNDDVFGAYYTLGEGAPDAPGNYAISPWVLLEGRNSITYYTKFDPDTRLVMLISVYVYGVKEIKDDAGVAIQSKDT